MSNIIAISVENLSKRYEIGASKRYYDTFRDHFESAVKSLFKRNGSRAARTETFWALKNVSFEVKAGDVVGVIGKNGAGKSTLLKILSRITEPSIGFAEIRGTAGDYSRSFSQQGKRIRVDAAVPIIAIGKPTRYYPAGL